MDAVLRLKVLLRKKINGTFIDNLRKSIVT